MKKSLFIFAKLSYIYIMTDEESKQLVANNIANFRKEKGLTQLELADQLHYSDKLVSKWESGNGFPDIFTLKTLADFFGIQVDDFYSVKPAKVKKDRQTKKEIVIPLLADGLAWLIIALLFAIAEIFFHDTFYATWLLFVYGMPITGILFTIFSAIYRRKIELFFSVSIIIWGLCTSIFLTSLMVLRHNGESINNLWLIFIVGAPLQILAILSYILMTDKLFFQKLFSKKRKVNK